MLVREQNLIYGIVTEAWGRLTAAAQVEAEKASALAVSAFKSDPRLKALDDALEGVGAVRHEEAAWDLVNPGYPLRATITGGYRESSLMRDIADARTSAAVKSLSVYSEPSFAELALALSSAKKKWADLQTPLYALMADVGSATDYDGIRMAIRTFTSSIS